MGAAEIKTDVDAILALGAEMSNVRGMLEDYTIIGAKIKFKHPDERLKASIAEYEETMGNLKKQFKDDATIQKSVNESLTAWKPIKKALETAQTQTDTKKMKEQALFIHGNIRSVIKEAANMKAYLLGKATNFKDIKELNAAIEIAASARRLSAHYMMKMWNLDDPTIDKHWKKGVKIYTDSIATLKKSPFYKDVAFKKLLDKTESMLQYFTMAYDMDGTYMPSVVHDKASTAFEAANKMSKMILAKK